MLSKLGFSHVQVSPIQESNNESPESKNIWWNAYQPLSYNIGGQYGTEEEFKELLAEAAGDGLKIIVDVVFNHLAPMYKYSEASAGANASMRVGDEWRDAWTNRPLLNAYLDQVIEKYKKIGFTQREHFREPPKWGFGDGGKKFPTLNLDNTQVLSIQTAFLKKLADMGVAGFRFDAIGNFGNAWAHFNSYVKSIMRDTPGAFSYGEHASGDVASYTHFQAIGQNDDDCRTMDFVLYYQLGNAFPLGKSLRAIAIPTINGDAWGAVTFAENHDTWAYRQIGILHGGLPGWDGDEIDRLLATAYLLIRKGGVPLVFNNTFNLKSTGDSTIIKDALSFRLAMRKANAPIENIEVINDDVVKINRGVEGFAVINKAAIPFDNFNFPYDDYDIAPRSLVVNVASKSVVIPARGVAFFYQKSIKKKKGAKRKVTQTEMTPGRALTDAK